VEPHQGEEEEPASLDLDDVSGFVVTPAPLEIAGPGETISRKVSILMTNSTFKWKLLIIHLLNISPLNKGELNSLR
jgi:hypothetical protein